MNSRRDADGARDLRTLFCAGTLTGLTDGQLLECFATRNGEESEQAFASLVERHGSLVLHACRAVLRDEHDARDAFQATFLILARRGRSLWVRDSVGPWLYRVARRAALRARRNAHRRRVVERQALDAARPQREAGEEGLAAVVHEEIGRLAERYRIPVLLCDLEGRSYEEAARHLGCPVGTVKSRLARGRARLRASLTRRGVAPAAGALVAVPAAWARDAVRAATSPKMASAVSAAVTSLTREVLKSMLLIQLRVASGIFAIGMIALSAFVVAAGPSSGPRQGPPPPATQPKGVPTRAGLFAPQAWRSEPYRPPDFAVFFPDDPEGARALAALWDEVKREMEHQEATPKVPGRTPWWSARNRLSDDEILQRVRRGLRRIDGERRMWVIRWIGVRYIPEKGPQNPDAIEILYHAMDYRDDRHYDNATCRYAQGPCSIHVQPKTHALLRALVELGMREDNPSILSNIVTAMATAGPAGRAEMLADLAPYLASGDAVVREKAEALLRMFKDEIDCWEWAVEPARKRARARYGSQLPRFREALRSGSSREREQTIEFLGEERIDLILDASFVEPLRACADDPEEDVRMGVFTLTTEPWFAGLRKRPEGVNLVARLLKDRSHRIRSFAVKDALDRKIALPEPVVRDLVQAVITDPQGLFGDIGMDEITAGLRPSRAAVEKVLGECLRDPALARSARSWYRTMVEADPPTGAPTDGPYAKPLENLYDFLGRTYPNFELKKIDWAAVGRELLPRASSAKTEREFGLLVQELVARLEDSHAAVLPGTAQPPMPDLPRWDPGLACLIDDRGRPVVSHVDHGSPADGAGIAPGMAIVSVNGVNATEAMERWMRRQRTYVGYSSERQLQAEAASGFVRCDKKGDRLALVLLSPDGASKSVEVAADLGARYLPRLPVPRPGIVDAADVSWTTLDGLIGYIYVRRIRQGLERSLDRALRELGDIRGLIIDVRGNSGGGFDTATAFVNFEPAPVAAGGPLRPRYAGPIALLLNERTISAGEGWASWFVARKRARVFGSTSAGASSRKVTYDLTNGLYKVVVPVKAYTGSLDRPIERRGLEPDVAVRCTASDLSRGRDTVVETAALWLRQNPQ